MFRFNVFLCHFYHQQTLSYIADNVRPGDRKLSPGNKEGRSEREDDVLKGLGSASKAPFSFLYFPRILGGGRDSVLSSWNPNPTVVSILAFIHFLILGGMNVELQAKKLTENAHENLPVIPPLVDVGL